jgi:hypothetical protein
LGSGKEEALRAERELRGTNLEHAGQAPHKEGLKESSGVLHVQQSADLGAHGLHVRRAKVSAKERQGLLHKGGEAGGEASAVKSEVDEQGCSGRGQGGGRHREEQLAPRRAQEDGGRGRREGQE